MNAISSAESRFARGRTLGVVLIVIVGLLNFHIPHFLIEPSTGAADASSPVELVFLANLVGGLVAAVGIYRNRGWGWLLGIAIVGLSIGLYVTQETVGLSGLPKNWFEPSRLVALGIDGLFVLVAWRQVAAHGRRRPG